MSSGTLQFLLVLSYRFRYFTSDVALILSTTIPLTGTTRRHRHWFYEDFLRPLNSSLPSLNLRKFSIYILQTASLSVPLIRQYVSSGSDKDEQGTVSDLKTLGGATYGLEAAFDEFMKYKTRVPVCGAVLLSEDWKSVR